MHFNFDGHQDYQLEAIAAVVDLFEGQPLIKSTFDFTLGAGGAVISNELRLSHEELLRNLRGVQVRKNIALSEQLECIEQQVSGAGGSLEVNFPNFSVEMETGTGKTYVYLRTALELAQRYGLRKFVVVVPSVAIREGVLTTLRLTKSHFRELTGGLPYASYAYNSSKLGQFKQFCQSSTIEIMVMTLDAFNKDSNVIRQGGDAMFGETPLHLIQQTRPVLILDEPQNMESDLSISALASLNPVFALRYSATHRKAYNVVYRLTPFEAYQRGLVKKIEIASVVQDHDPSQAFLALKEIEQKKTKITAKLTVRLLDGRGAVKEKDLVIRRGDDLRIKTKRAAYTGYVVDSVDPIRRTVLFKNGVEIGVGEQRGEDRRALMESQVRATVEEHMRKQARFGDEVKVLSLFFIDRVDNYVPADGSIREMFERAFEELKLRYPEWSGKAVRDVHTGYFAQKRSKTGTVTTLDTKEGARTGEDEAAFKLIMQAKEQLLSFEEPTAFIFSHSALREGWDNPNVFQICSLNDAVSEPRRRQEIGRGVRLAVDRHGNRIHEDRVNILTVVANESYQQYVDGLQRDIFENYREEIEGRYNKKLEALTDEERAAISKEFGQGLLPPKPMNARQRRSVHLDEAKRLSPEFQQLWAKISARTRYRVTLDTEQLIKDVLPELGTIEVSEPQISMTRAMLQAEGGTFKAIQLSDPHVLVEQKRTSLPNVLDLIAAQLERFTPPLRLTRNTLFKIYEGLKNKDMVMRNPEMFAVEAARRIRTMLGKQLVSGIQYERNGQYYDASQLATPIESWEDNLEASPRGLYDHIEADSNIEHEFAANLNLRDDVRLYMKLPRWFKVPTPIGNYNPDWAIVAEERDASGEASDKLLYLIRETKATTYTGDLRQSEQLKVECGERHFEEALGVNYEVTTDAKILRRKT